MIEADRQNTKKRLLSLTLEIIESEGADALTIRKLAKRAGVALSVVHHHYVNKQDLLDACKVDYYEGVGVLVQELLAKASDKPIKEFVDVVVRELFRNARNRISIARLLAQDVYRSGEIIERYRGYEQRPFFSVSAALLASKLGLTIRETRARIQAAIALLTRFATSSNEELVGVFGENGDDILRVAEDELVVMSQLLLLGRLEDT